MKKRLLAYMNKIRPQEIQSTIMVTFTVISLAVMLIFGVVLYNRFGTIFREDTIISTEKLMEQTVENLEDYLGRMRQISDAVYYNAIKENDLSSENQTVQMKMNLVYEVNKENLRSIALYNNSGSLMAAEPLAVQKEDPNVTKQDWFIQAVGKMENMHFSTPHIQNLFDDGTQQYYWVISLSRMVELTDKGNSQLGVLLVDMNYSSISRMMNQINADNNGQYYFLCDNNGEIIYHPKQTQIVEGIYQENNAKIAQYDDGVHKEHFRGDRRTVVVNTVGYTGWKLIGVIPDSFFAYAMSHIRYYVMMLLILMAMMLLVANRIISVRISRPILKLNKSVSEYEAGEKPEIYIGGSLEIRHLGNSIQSSYEQIDTLMKKIVLEQNERRKSELDALQSQINPHFLYNALDSIVWMIEGERNDEASYMVSQLAKLFRISLSKGKTVISVKDELQHAKSYMNIQKIRYKNSFSVTFDIDPEVEKYCTVKLILQPILENAINYGVSGMDDCGKICVIAKMEDEDIVLSVVDNGLGMTKENAELLLTGSNTVRKHGSGVGLVNVNNRIKILFGEGYGIAVESEIDEGTTVSIRIPAITYTEENGKILERGYLFAADEIQNMKARRAAHEEG